MEKCKISNNEKYGTDYASQSDIIKNKTKQTCILKYDEESYMKTNEFREKSKITNIEKFGTEYASQSEEIKNKVKQTNLHRFGVEYPSQLDLIKDKVKQTLLDKYSTNPQLLIEVKEKNKKTNLKRYNTEYYSQSEEYKEIVKNRKIPHLKEKFNLNILNVENNIIEYHCESCNKDIKSDYQLIYNRMVYDTIMCENCNPINNAISGNEIQLQNFIKENYDKEIILNSRQVINPLELDIYLPDLKLAFEYNGLYWHNEQNKPNDYHYNKTELCEKIDVHLIHIYEDDWKYKQDIVKSRILNLLGKTSNKIFARKCVIKEIDDNTIIRKFLVDNHQQGFVGSQIKIGLFYNDELVSLMIFGKQRKSMGTKQNKDIYEMLRFCNKLNTSIIGGSSKLFDYFIKIYNPVEVISYADRSWSQGNLYKKLRFDLVHKTKPNYYYIINDVRKYRFNFRKDILIKEGFDSNKTEKEIMLERRIFRIYDSGSLKFIFKKCD